MSLTPHQALSIVIIIYYVPSLVPTSLLLHRHSLGKAWGWLYLFIFAIFRVTGASLQFASGFIESTGLRRAASMLASIGAMTLLLAMLEFIMNVKTTLGTSDPTHPRLWTLLHLSQWAAVILSIVFTTAGGQNLNRAAAVIVTCLFASQVIISLVFYLRLRAPGSASDIQQQPGKEKDDHPQIYKITGRLLLILLCSTPLLTVRVVYMLLATFIQDSMFTGKDLTAHSDNNISGEYTLPNIYIVAFMQYFMEFIIFALFVYAGLIMPSLREEKEREKMLKDEAENGSQVELRGRERGSFV